MKRFLKLLLISALAILPSIQPAQRAEAAASLQVLHVWLCAPDVAVGPQGPRLVVNTSSTASPQPSYQLNSTGCALFNNADVGFFLSQGFTVGVNENVLQQNAITSSGTTSVTTTIALPAYGFIKYIIVEETAGNAVTGGINVGDSGSATRFLSATAVAANANVVVVPTNLNGSASTGIPTQDTVLINAVTSWNSASLNVSVIVGYY
jgi:hypothetical protein